MGMLILFVLCTVVLVSTYSDLTYRQHLQADTFTKTRIKRESENDCVKRDHRVFLAPVTASRRPTIQPVSPTHVHLKPNLVIRPNNASSNRIIVPVRHIKAKALTKTTEASINSVNVTDDDIDRTVNDTELDEILKPFENNITVDEPIIYNGSNIIQNDLILKSEIKEQQVQEAPNIITEEEGKETIASDEKATRNYTTNKMVNQTLDYIEKDLMLNLDSKPMLPTDTPKRVAIIRNTSKLLFKDARENVNNHIINNDEAPVILANDVSNHTNASVIGVKIGIMPIPLSFLTSAAITPIPKAKHVVSPQLTRIPDKPEIKETPEDSADTIFRKIGNGDNKITVVNNMGDPLLPKSIETEPDDEILIQNNNYEELFESSPSSQYLPPKFNAIELCPAPNWNNFHPAPFTPLEKIDEPKNADVNNNKAYSYDVKAYPNHYVVDVYNGYRNGYHNTNFNQDQGDNNVTPLASNVGKQSNSKLKYYNRVSSYPRDRIWRSWQNNQIVIKPKLPNSLNNEELYKNINEYVANARRTAVNNGAAKIISTNGGVNQNVSPRSYNDPFQLSKMYGY